MKESDPKDLPWHDDPQGYEQGLAVLICVGIAILFIVAVAIGVGLVWGFEIVLKGILILASVVVGLFVFYFVIHMVEDHVVYWSGWPYVAVLLFVTAVLGVWIFWGWGGILGIDIGLVLAFIVLYSRPPWPF